MAQTQAGLLVRRPASPSDEPQGIDHLTTDGSGNLNVNVQAGGGGGGGGAVTVADGADVTQGAVADAAVSTDATGTLSAKMRGLVKLLAQAFALGTPLRVDPVGSTTQPVSGTVAVTQSTSPWVGNVTQFGSNNVATGTGAAGNGVPRVTVSNDSQVIATGVGAAGASVAGNPLRTGALGRTSLPTAVSSAQLVDILADRYGRLYRISPVLTNTGSAGTPITTNTNTQIIAAPSAGNHLRIHRLWAQNSGTGTWAYWGNGSGVKTIPFYLSQNQPMMMTLSGSWELSTATALFMNTATTACSIEYYVEYETLTD